MTTVTRGEARVRPLFSVRSASGAAPLGEGVARTRPLFEAATAEEPPGPPPGSAGPDRAAAPACPPLPEPEAEAGAPPPSSEEAEPPAEPPCDPYAELRAAQAEAEAARARYVEALREIARVHAADFSALENDLVDVAMEIARAILMRELETDRLYVVRLVEAALRVAVEDEAASVVVAPADLALVEQERARLEVQRGGGLVRVTADPALHPGDCVVQVGRARIDARLGDRLERVRQALHGVVTETE